jgi:hypothetical protein
MYKTVKETQRGNKNNVNKKAVFLGVGDLFTNPKYRKFGRNNEIEF